MKDVILNMDLAELGITALALLIGIVAGYLISGIRNFIRDKKFAREEKQIGKQVSRLNLYKIKELSEQGKIKIDPAFKTLLEKIDHHLNGIDVYHRERSEIEDDIDDLSSILQQLANA